jgi:hypothetical protein
MTPEEINELKQGLFALVERVDKIDLSLFRPCEFVEKNGRKVWDTGGVIDQIKSLENRLDWLEENAR